MSKCSKKNEQSPRSSSSDSLSQKVTRKFECRFIRPVIFDRPQQVVFMNSRCNRPGSTNSSWSRIMRRNEVDRLIDKGTLHAELTDGSEDEYYNCADSGDDRENSGGVDVDEFMLQTMREMHEREAKPIEMKLENSTTVVKEGHKVNDKEQANEQKQEPLIALHVEMKVSETSTIKNDDRQCKLSLKNVDKNGRNVVSQSVLQMKDVAYRPSITTWGNTMSLDIVTAPEAEVIGCKEAILHRNCRSLPILTYQLTQLSPYSNIINTVVPRNNAESVKYLHPDDPDLEYEMRHRAEYAKLFSEKPQLPDSKENSNESQKEAHFVQIEGSVPSVEVSYLKNVASLRFTELTDDGTKDVPKISKKAKVKVRTKAQKIKTKLIKSTDNENTVIVTPRKKVNTRKFRKTTQKQKPLLIVTQQISTTPKRTPSTAKKNMNAHRLNVVNESILKKESKKSFRRKPRAKEVVLTKSVEEIKKKKTAIFLKMTSTQEHIIEVLDKLRLNIIDVYVPNSKYQRPRVQNGVFDFSVRLSRSFLFPLRAMVNDLKVMRTDLFNSVTSHHACIRISNIFSLILQGLHAYDRHLHYFIFDHVAQKLNTLVELIYLAVVICLNKKIFDNHDVIVDCLRERCLKFLDFLDDLSNDRIQVVQSSTKSLGKKVSKTYDLKMCMNELNMYEAKLIPKNQSNTKIRKERRRLKSTTATPAPINVVPSLDMIVEVPEDNIATQMQKLQSSEESSVAESLHELLSPAKNPPKSFRHGLPYINLLEKFDEAKYEEMSKLLRPILGDGYRDEVTEKQLLQITESFHLDSIAFKKKKKRERKVVSKKEESLSVRGSKKCAPKLHSKLKP